MSTCVHIDNWREIDLKMLKGLPIDDGLSESKALKISGFISNFHRDFPGMSEKQSFANEL